MVDHEEQQILRRLEDDALAEARRKAQEAGQQELEEAETPTSEEVPSEDGDVEHPRVAIP